MPRSLLIGVTYFHRKLLIWSKKSRAIGGATAAVIIITMIIIAALALVFLAQPTRLQNNKLGASLSVQDFNASYLSFNKTSHIAITLRNNGDSSASSVAISLSSPAFANASSLATQSIDPASQGTFSFDLRSYDVKNGVYAVSISASYADIHGQARVSLGTQQVTVLPAIKIVGVGWLWPLGNLAAKSTIGRIDSTESHFRVQSLSTQAQYNNLTASENFLGDHSGLTISPTIVQLGTIGPQGPSDEYKFTIQSNNAPPGQYAIIIAISSAGIVVGTTTVILTVS